MNENGKGEIKINENEEGPERRNGLGEGVVLGLDGGTTSTVCVCMPFLEFIDDHSLHHPPPILSRAVSGCSNHNSIGETAARDALKEVVVEALSKSGFALSAVRAVCLGVSGVNHATDQERIENWLREVFPSNVRIYVKNDALAALASGTMGKLHGCVLIAGTGSICYGVSGDGKEARAAGAGPVLGDWGSGYGIAAQALTAVMRAYDGRGPPTKLTNVILTTLGLSSPDELIGQVAFTAETLTHFNKNRAVLIPESNGLTIQTHSIRIWWTYADQSWARIAALVPQVVSCAEVGDEVANKILVDAVQELSSCVKAVVRRINLCDEEEDAGFPVVMVGGVLENKGWDIEKEVVKNIHKDFPGAIPIRPKVEPAVGAALLALRFLMQE